MPIFVLLCSNNKPFRGNLKKTKTAKKMNHTTTMQRVGQRAENARNEKQNVLLLIVTIVLALGTIVLNAYMKTL